MGAEEAGAAPPDPFADALAEAAPLPPATGMLPFSGDTIDANLLCAPLPECAVTAMAGLAGAPGEPRCAIPMDWRSGERCADCVVQKRASEDVIRWTGMSTSTESGSSERRAGAVGWGRRVRSAWRCPSLLSLAPFRSQWAGMPIALLAHRVQVSTAMMIPAASDPVCSRRRVCCAGYWPLRWWPFRWSRRRAQRRQCECARRRSSECTPPQCTCPFLPLLPPLCLCVRVSAVQCSAVHCSHCDRPAPLARPVQSDRQQREEADRSATQRRWRTNNQHVEDL